MTLTALSMDDWEFGRGVREITREQVHDGSVRRCANWDCGTILHQYNDTGWCALCRSKQEDTRLKTKTVRRVYQERYRAEQRKRKQAEKAGKAVEPPKPKPKRLPAGAWSPFFETCQDCGTTDNKHHACGFCQPCYMRRYSGSTERRERSHEWSLNYAYCTQCNTTEARHRARGLCTRCYEVARRKASRSARLATG